LLKCSDLPYASSTQTSGRWAATISAGPHSLVIPSGALNAPTNITMTALTGLGRERGQVCARRAAVQFARHADDELLELQPARQAASKRIAYTDDNLNI